MSNLKRYARTCAILLLVGILVFGGSIVLGKSSSDRISKEPPKIEAGQSWMAAIYSVVALAGICVVAFKNPKRTHSD